MGEIPGQQRLRNDKFTMGYGDAREFPPVKFAQRAAVDYSKRIGAGRYMPHAQYRQLATTQVDPERGHATMMAYRQAQRNPEEAPGIRQSYEAMRQEVNEQYQHMTRPQSQGGMGMKHEVTTEDPYPSSADMAADVAKGRIKTFATASTGGHEFFTNEENDRFRAVHDVFGHAAIGRGFTRHGEEAAFQHHAQMFSPKALPALTSETRGQNSYLNYHPAGAQFPDQGPGSKLIGLPHWAGDVGPVQLAPQGETDPDNPAWHHNRTERFEQGTLFNG